jgi:hypothetical protein
MGYDHERVTHSEGVYLKGEAYTNTIKGFWLTVKNGIKGVFHSVSSKYLQGYMNEYAFRCNHRDDEQPMFLTMLQKVTTP